MSTGARSIFEIVLQRKTDEGWPVLMKHTPPGELFASRSEGTMQLKREDLLASGSPKAYGEVLGKALFQQSLWGAFAAALAQARQGEDLLRVLLTNEDADLRELHWERLCAPFDSCWDFLSMRQETPFSINLPSLSGRSFQPIGRQDLRALLLVAGPDDLSGKYGLPPFDTPQTVALVREALGKIPVDVLASGVEGALGKPDVDTLCERLTAGRYTLLHIVSHGQHARGETRLMLPDSKGMPVPGSALIERLGRIQELAGAGGLPYFTFLMSCASADPRAENGFGGLGQRLVRELGMPAVLAMTDPVSMQTANALARQFYDYLSRHGEVDRALSEALAPQMGRPDVTVPAVFSRLEGRPLFSESLDREPTPVEIQHGLERLAVLAHERAPVLEKELQTRSARLRALAPVRTEALESAARGERAGLLGELNRLGEEICEVSFNALAAGEPVPAYDGRCPFRGLEVFRPQDQAFFFGREVLVQKLVVRLAQHPFLAVLGNSGSGKSSLVLAGLVPALERKKPDFKYAYLTPGNAPGERLRAALAQQPKAILVVIDQFEELFSPGIAPREREAFIRQVLALAPSRRVVITMRADFWGDCAPHRALVAAIQGCQELVAPMDAGELRRAIEQQAEAAGLVYETGLAGTIMEHVAGEPGAMPLLQHALLLLWQRRHGRWLRRAEYDAFGGVKRAIADTADQIFNKLSEAEQERMRAIFLRLTQPGHDTRPGIERRDTRRRVALSELVPAGEDPAETVELVRRLADARLVVTRTDAASQEEEVEVAHEALIQHWPRLRAWLEEDPIGLQLAEEIREAAGQWAAKRRVDRLVHRGERLDEALALQRRKRYTFNITDNEYLLECSRLRERERRRQRLLLIGAVIVAVVMTVLSIFAGNSSIRAGNNLRTSEARGTQAAEQAVTAEWERNRAEQAAATAEWERNRAEQAAATASAEANISLARQLAAQSKELWDAKSNVPRAVLLGIESLKRYPEASANQTVRDGLALLGVTVARMQHEGWVNALSFSPDGKWVVSGGGDGGVRVWEAATGLGIASMQHEGSVTAAAFSPDGQWVVSSSDDGSATVWEANTGHEIASIQHEEGVRSVAFSPDGTRVVSGSADGSVLVWEPATGEEIARMQHEGWVNVVAFSPDGTQVVSGGGGSSPFMFVWGAATGTEVARMQHADFVRSVSFSPDGTQVVSGGDDGSAIVWETETGVEVARMQHKESVRSVAFSPDGTRVVSGSADGSVLVWEAGTDTEVVPMQHQGHVTSVAFSPDGTRVISGSWDGSARLWEAATGTEVTRMQHESVVHSVAFSPDGSWVVSGGEDGSVLVWEAAMGMEIVRTQLANEVKSAAFSPDGSWVVSGGEDGSVLVREAATGAEIARMQQESEVTSLAFSPDGKRVVSGSCDHRSKDYTCTMGSVLMWEAATGVQIARMQHESMITAVAISPDGMRVVSGGEDGSVLVWEAETRTKFASMKHAGAVSSLAFSPDGMRVVSAGCDQHDEVGDCIMGSARVWEAATGREVARMTHEGWVFSVAFSPDGMRVVSGGEDGSARVWLWQPEDLIAEACKRLEHNLSPAEWQQYLGENIPYERTCPDLPAGEDKLLRPRG